MKKFIIFGLSILFAASFMLVNEPIFVKKHLAMATETPQKKLMAIVVDDFGGFERAGVDDLLTSSVPVTCAIIPFADNTQADYDRATAAGKEVILHMPMQAHVKLPDSWYGSVFIRNDDTQAAAVEKLDKCVKSLPNIAGFNIHIGSGVCQNVELMKAVYDYANDHNLYFLDSRTIISDKCEEACQASNSIYLGRDVFLEPSHNRSYKGVMKQLQEGFSIAQEKGYAIVIGHVGPEGGNNTARAIIDFAKSIKDSDVEIVALNRVYEKIKSEQFK